jgi:acyl-coenzyme A synthetase/AMP-(fatty) acid ligase
MLGSQDDSRGPRARSLAEGSMEPRAQNPISGAFAALARSVPGAPLVVSTARTATVGDVAAGAGIVERLVAPCTESPGRWPAGAVVGLAAGNGPGLLSGLVALWRLGLAALLLDPQAPEAEGRRIARSLGAAGLLRCRTPWPAEAADWALADLAGAREKSAEEGAALADCAVVKLTSGSTGAPRGVVTPAAALVADDAALTASMKLDAADRLLAFIPLSHSYGLSSLVLPALLRGTALVVPEEGSFLEPFSAAERAGATFFPTVPAYVQALLRLSHPPAWPRSLRLVIAAGAPLEPAAARGFRETFGLPVHVFYGASECGGICYDREGGAGERGTVGTPLDGVRVTLAPPPGSCRNGEGAIEPAGVVTVESPAVASGYLPEPDPRLADGRFTARDLAAFRDGELALRGRLDDLINVKGKKVDPREVEGVVGALAGVDEVVVLGVPAPEGGAEIVRAVIACRPGLLRAEEVLAYCREHLSAHKVPRSVILVPEMPRTARGKIDRPALLALAPAPVRSYGC